jgi:hypothetical protein
LSFSQKAVLGHPKAAFFMFTCDLGNRSIFHPRSGNTFMAMQIVLNPITRLVALTGFLTLLSSCSFMPSSELQSVTESIAASKDRAYAPFPSVGLASIAAQAPASGRWQHYPLPGKQPTTYRYAWVDGRHAMQATAKMSASMLRQPLRVVPEQLGAIRFSWKVPQLIEGADLAQRDTHDSPVRLALTFEGDRSLFSAKNSMLSELASALTGEALPYATLMYVWCNACPTDEVFSSPRTDRIREIALESGPDQLGQWRHYERDIRADFEKAFGEPPGALLGVGLMTDTDNTRQTATAWYGAVSLAN